MEEIMGMDMVQTGQYLEQDALNTLAIQTLMISCLHQLIEIEVHVFHTNM